MVNDITPVDIWKDGYTETAHKLSLVITLDDLQTRAVFFYELLTSSNIHVTGGNLVISGSEYTTWNTGANATTAAFTWAADQLNLTLV